MLLCNTGNLHLMAYKLIPIYWFIILCSPHFPRISLFVTERLSKMLDSYESWHSISMFYLGGMLNSKFLCYFLIEIMFYVFASSLITWYLNCLFLFSTKFFVSFKWIRLEGFLFNNYFLLSFFSWCITCFCIMKLQ